MEGVEDYRKGLYRIIRKILSEKNIERDKWNKISKMLMIIFKY